MSTQAEDDAAALLALFRAAIGSTCWSTSMASGSFIRAISAGRSTGLLGLTQKRTIGRAFSEQLGGAALSVFRATH